MNENEVNRFLKGIEKKSLTIIRYHTKNSDDSFDILQDSMISFVSKYSKVKEEEAAPLFYRITQNKINDWHRKKSSFLKIFNPEKNIEDVNIIDEKGTLEEDYGSFYNTKKIKIVIDKLSKRQKEVFLLKVIEEFTSEEVGKILKCSESSVKTHYKRAVDILRDELSDELSDEEI
jgi:RNA polymerase sigma-70 factor (ECF subfamily)